MARRGRVAPGLDADLVVLTADPARDVRNFASVRCAFRTGKPVFTASTAIRRNATPGRKEDARASARGGSQCRAPGGDWSAGTARFLDRRSRSKADRARLHARGRRLRAGRTQGCQGPGRRALRPEPVCAARAARPGAGAHPPGIAPRRDCRGPDREPPRTQRMAARTSPGWPGKPGPGNSGPRCPKTGRKRLGRPDFCNTGAFQRIISALRWTATSRSTTAGNPNPTAKALTL